MTIVALICARGGSKGLPGKNIRYLGGKPLIGWSIEQARAVKRIDHVIVSTDSEEIASVAIDFGAQVPFLRPPELARDDSAEWMVWRHALRFLEEKNGAMPTIMVSIPATAPLRSTEDIENCIDMYERNSVDMVITVTDANRNPHFNMVKTNLDGTVGLVIPPQSLITRRQDAPVVYDMATVCYVANPIFVMNHQSIFEGRVKAVHVPIDRAIDIDTYLDFQIAESIFKLRK